MIIMKIRTLIGSLTTALLLFTECLSMSEIIVKTQQADAVSLFSMGDDLLS